ncbi:MAG: DUF4167 domain-containing protein [Alphaproteobacteria bacterium]|nr:DUF4167 domain-containing protein [Alphaproteobacteria bacterium]
MKKVNNNKFRGNNVYSLNYKFDSVSSAGKFSGTALDLIKRYNELAKEAQSNGDYVEMEVFRQYAEHYRKIVTEINERKNQYRDNQSDNQENYADNTSETQENGTDNGLVETESAAPAPENIQETENNESENTADSGEAKKTLHRRRGFTVIEVSEKAEEKKENASVEKTHRRVLNRRTSAKAGNAEA